MGPVGRVPSNFGESWDRVYLVPFNFYVWLWLSFPIGSTLNNK